METVKEGEVLIMKKNPDYYGFDKDGNKLPYLDGLKYTFIREKKAEILEFKSGNLDMVYRLPVEIFHEIMGDLEHAKERKTDFQILSSPAFNTNYLGFNCISPSFNKKEVRLAFNYAIAVSYTHLDVYKRQILTSIAGGATALEAVVRTLVGVLIII